MTPEWCCKDNAILRENLLWIFRNNLAWLDCQYSLETLDDIFSQSQRLSASSWRKLLQTRVEQFLEKQKTCERCSLTHSRELSLEWSVVQPGDWSAALLSTCVPHWRPASWTWRGLQRVQSWGESLKMSENFKKNRTTTRTISGITSGITSRTITRTTSRTTSRITGTTELQRTRITKTIKAPELPKQQKSSELFELRTLVIVWPVIGIWTLPLIVWWIELVNGKLIIIFITIFHSSSWS